MKRRAAEAVAPRTLGGRLALGLKRRVAVAVAPRLLGGRLA